MHIHIPNCHTHYSLKRGKSLVRRNGLLVKALCRNLLRSEGAQVYCEPPGHVAWQNGKRATPKERAELAAKVLKTIPTHCTSVEMVQENHDAERVLSSPHRSLHSSGGQKQTPGESKSNFTGLYSPREREGRSIPLGRKQ